MSATGQMGEPLVFADVLVRVLQVVLLVAVWRTILGSDGEGFGLTLGQVLTYTLVAAALAPLFNIQSPLRFDLWHGTIAFRFVRPMSVFGQYAAELAGQWAFELAVLVPPLVVLAPLLGVSVLPADVGAGALFLLSLALAVVVGLALDFVFGAMMVLLEQSWYAVHMIRLAVTTLLSGFLLPLDAYPWGLGAVFAWLPFASTASAPLRIYVGDGDPSLLIARQVAWAVVLWPLVRHLWARNRQRLVLYGG